jgi:hypothetical protein
MELDITHMIKDSDDMPLLSGSIAELGNSAAAITWRNSVAYGKAHPLLTDEAARDEARRYFADFGAWDADEIASWSDAELDGLVTQYIAGSIREMESLGDRYEQECGNVYRGDDGRWYFYLGS